MKKQFAKSLLLDEVGILDLALGHPSPDGWELVATRMTDKSRWSVHYEAIFREPGQPQGEAWKADYSVGATESQDEGPWEYVEQVDAVKVRLTEKVVEVWEVVTD